MSDKPLSAADAILADALGAIAAELRQEWQRELDQLRDAARRDVEQIRLETRAAIAELRAVAAEALLARHDPEAAAKLRSIAGGRQ